MTTTTRDDTRHSNGRFTIEDRELLSAVMREQATIERQFGHPLTHGDPTGEMATWNALVEQVEKMRSTKP